MAYCMKCGATVEGSFCVNCGTPVGASGGSGPEIPPPPPAAAQSPVRPAAIPAPKKRKTLLWVLCGCLGLIVIAVILLVGTGSYFLHKAGGRPEVAMVKMMLSANPDVELISLDEDKGIIKVRDKKTGKTLTMNFEDVKKGKIVFQDEKNQTVEIQTQGEGKESTMEIRSSEGTVRMGSSAGVQLPAWLPAYPGAESSGAFNATKPDANSGACTLKSGDSPENVAAFYENALQRGGFKVQKTSTPIPGQGSYVILSATSDNRTAQVTITKDVQKATVIGLIYGTK